MEHPSPYADVTDLLDSLELGEHDNLEAKLALGGIPKSIWPTLSAFANTSGGYVLLGIEEAAGSWRVQGITHARSMVNDLHSQLRNHQKISFEVADANNIRIVDVEGQDVIVVRVRPAPRRSRPVYIEGRQEQSFVRRGEGDHRCTVDEIRRMLREATTDDNDLRVLPFLGFDHLDWDTVRRFRSRFKQTNPHSHLNNIEDRPFLTQIGVYRADLQRGETGLTIAGTLLLGQELAIREIRSAHQLDYRVRLGDQLTAERWIERDVWNGNLLDFYDSISFRMQRTLPNPFHVIGDQRIDDPPGRSAIHESLVNLLVHADYAENGISVIDQTPQGVTMRNPGSSRISRDELYVGGRSQHRNPTLARLFRQIGLADQAGTGLSKIFDDWKMLKFRRPIVRSDDDRYEFTIDLRFSDLRSSDDRAWLEELDHTFSETEELALVLARHGELDNVTLRSTADIHAADATQVLRSLREAGFLIKTGGPRWAKYTLTDHALGLSSQNIIGGSVGTNNGPEDTNKLTKDPNSDVRDTNNPNVEAEATLRDVLLPLEPRLRTIAQPVAQSRRASADVIRQVIHELCKVAPLTVQDLTVLTGRKANRIRQVLQELRQSNHVEVTTFPETAIPTYRALSQDSQLPLFDHSS